MAGTWSLLLSCLYWTVSSFSPLKTLEDFTTDQSEAVPLTVTVSIGEKRIFLLLFCVSYFFFMCFNAGSQCDCSVSCVFHVCLFSCISCCNVVNHEESLAYNKYSMLKKTLFMMTLITLPTWADARDLMTGI